MKRTSSAKDAPGRPLGQILDSLLLDQRLAILDQLALQLAELHEQEQWYGALGLDTVVLSDEGLVQLLPLEQGRRSLVQARAQGMRFDEPCAAPEQYVDEPSRPAGPWTDVYGYAALRWQLTTGLPLMAAPWRQLRDPVVMDEDADGPTQAMLQGLALDWVQRPQSMSSYRRLERLGQMPEPVPEHTPAMQPVLPVTPERRSALPLWVAGLGLLVLLGVGAVYWGGDSETSEPVVASADRNRPTVAGHMPEGQGQTSGAGVAGQRGTQEQVVRGEPKLADVAALGTGVASVETESASGEQAGKEQRVSGQSQMPQQALLPGQQTGQQGQQQSEGIPVSSPGQSLETGQLGGVATSAQGGSLATAAGEPLAQGLDLNTEEKPELKVLSESGGLQPVLSAQSENRESGALVLGDHAAGTSGTSDVGGVIQATTASEGVAIAAGTAGGASVASAAESLESSMQTGHVEQLDPVATKPAPPAKGSVALDVRPWGEVYVNGRKQGVSPPLKSLSLTPGSHRIVIKNAGLPEFSTTIRVRSGKTASVSHEFK